MDVEIQSRVTAVTSRMCATRIAPLREVKVGLRIDLEALRESAQETTAEPSAWGGYRVLLCGEQHTITWDLPPDPDSYVVVGRHPSARLRTDRDDRISLRHVIMIPQPCSPTSPQTRLLVLDLQSSAGLVDPEGARHRTLLAQGEVVFRLGRSAVYACPIDRQGIAMPAAGALEQLAAIRERGATPDGEIAGRLELRNEQQGAFFLLGRKELETGVVVGRTKYFCEPVSAILHDFISRAHVLLRLEAGVMVAYDLCSLGGTFLDDGEVGRVELPAGKRLDLACDPAEEQRWVSLKWHPGKDAPIGYEPGASGIVQLRNDRDR